MLYWETGQLLPFIDKSSATLPNHGAFAAATTRGKKKGEEEARSQRACCEVTSLGASSAEPRHTASCGAAAQALAEQLHNSLVTELLPWHSERTCQCHSKAAAGTLLRAVLPPDRARSLNRSPAS